MKFNELDVVKSLKNFPEKKIIKGEIGVIVIVFTVPNEAYEVEFVNSDGTTKSIFTLLPEEIEKV
ncbi:MAG: DUF4926 domain-containing protein [Sebaldella sp.]|nr:DUF4926 domain-containing protein [Sebaldella sp.]